jgi:transposase
VIRFRLTVEGGDRGMALAIRRDRTPASLRMWARRANSPRAASRAYAIANALEGMSRAEAARLAGMERQALRDAVVRYNAEGVSGLSDRPRIRPARLTEGQQATLRALLLRGPNPDRDGVSSWTRADIADLIEQRFGHRYHVSSLSKILRALGFSRQKTRPSHPNADPKARAAWLKKGGPRSPRRGGESASRQADCAVFPG